MRKIRNFRERAEERERNFVKKKENKREQRRGDDATKMEKNN